MKTIFVPCFLKKEFSLSNLTESLSQQLPYHKIGLFSTIQHLNQLEPVKHFLELQGKEVAWGGQILGCDVEKVKRLSEKVDAFLYLGSGRFHPLNIALNSRKPVVILNPYSCSLSEISREEIDKYEKKRTGAIGKALQGEVFGILVSLKTAQFSCRQGKKIKEELENKQKKAFLFAGGEISPEKLVGFDVDVWINTACPRIIEDHFDKPILNPEEMKFII